MTPKEFTDKVSQLANGKYHTCEWKRTVYSDSDVEIRISAYIEGYKYTPDYSTAELVIANLEGQIAQKT